MKTKKFLLLSTLLLPLVLGAAGSPNHARRADRIYLDSVKGNGGGSERRMCRQDRTEGGETLSLPDFDDSAWLSARVPGTVLTNLVENGLLPDPYFSDNTRLSKGLIPDITQVGRGYYTYWFRTEFDIPESYAGKKVWLHPEGINYRAEFWVNGHLFSTLTGMFRDDDIDITEFANIGGRNALAVLVYPVDSPGRPGKKTWGPRANTTTAETATSA